MVWLANSGKTKDIKLTQPQTSHTVATFPRGKAAAEQPTAVQTTLDQLKGMSYREIMELAAALPGITEKAKVRDRVKARTAATIAASKFGFKLNELGGEESPAKPKAASKLPVKAKAKKRSKGKVKYRNPLNKAQTWTGKGRQPNWYRTAIAAGTTPASMEHRLYD